MAFTRFHDDPCRKIKQAQELTGPGRWQLDVPGNGDNMPFMLDPQIRAQKWGANLYTDFTDVSSSLLGIDRRISRDCLGKDEYNKNKSFLPFSNPRPMSYPTNDTLTTEQSRAILPAWTFRDLEQVDWHYPTMHNTIPTFENLVSTRYHEKKNFVRTPDCILNTGSGFQSLPVDRQTGQYVGGPNLCSTSNSCQPLRK